MQPFNKWYSANLMFSSRFMFNSLIFEVGIAIDKLRRYTIFPFLYLFRFIAIIQKIAVAPHLISYINHFRMYAAMQHRKALLVLPLELVVVF